MSGRAGCEELLIAVNTIKPALHLFGHIHQDGGVFTPPGHTTTFANVTTWESERGATVIDLDLNTLKVSPISIPVRDPMHPNDP